MCVCGGVPAWKPNSDLGVSHAGEGWLILLLAREQLGGRWEKKNDLDFFLFSRAKRDCCCQYVSFRDGVTQWDPHPDETSLRLQSMMLSLHLAAEEATSLRTKHEASCLKL